MATCSKPNLSDSDVENCVASSDESLNFDSDLFSTDTETDNDTDLDEIVSEANDFDHSEPSNDISHVSASDNESLMDNSLLNITLHDQHLTNISGTKSKFSELFNFQKIISTPSILNFDSSFS